LIVFLWWGCEQALQPSVVSVLAERTASGGTQAWTSSNGGTTVCCLMPGELSAAQMLQALLAQSATVTWALRLLGFLLWWLGLYLIVDPVAKLGDLLTIPALGLEPGTVLGYLLGAGTFVVALGLSVVTIAVAWLVYHPLYAVLALLAVAGAWALRAKTKKV
jgi:uncharacterized membrane protein (DUF485 family)